MYGKPLKSAPVCLWHTAGLVLSIASRRYCNAGWDMPDVVMILINCDTSTPTWLLAMLYVVRRQKLKTPWHKVSRSLNTLIVPNHWQCSNSHAAVSSLSGEI